jgi:hypothetical protein
MLRPTAFMEVWIDVILAKGIREKGVATIFGDGRAVANYIAVEDVAEFAVKILLRPEMMNEAVEAGGPSNLSQNELATLVERRLNRQAKRRHVPVMAMRLLPPIVRPFNEVAARLMTLGLYAAVYSTPFPEGVCGSVRDLAAERRNVPRSISPLTAALSGICAGTGSGRAILIRSGGKPPAVARAKSRIESSQSRFFPQRDRLSNAAVHHPIHTDHHLSGMPRDAG